MHRDEHQQCGKGRKEGLTRQPAPTAPGLVVIPHKKRITEPELRPLWWRLASVEEAQRRELDGSTQRVDR